ncbi:hypothetical protein PFISCL1PPCAC_22140, partial [Pristionchus fissidentatus]
IPTASNPSFAVHPTNQIPCVTRLRLHHHQLFPRLIVEQTDTRPILLRHFSADNERRPRVCLAT